MDLKKLSPWNWFKKEEEHEGKVLPARSPLPGIPSHHPLAAWQQEMDRVFGEAFRNFGFPAFPDMPSNAGWLKPQLDIVENPENYRISLEVPGVEEKDIHIELHGDTLTIKGEKRKEEESKQNNYHRIERSYGAFQRLLTLPANANPEGIDAKFKNGVLTLTIGKRPGSPEAGRRIEIKPE